jgi:hypothetical protein
MGKLLVVGCFCILGAVDPLKEVLSTAVYHAMYRPFAWSVSPDARVASRVAFRSINFVDCRRARCGACDTLKVIHNAAWNVPDRKRGSPTQRGGEILVLEALFLAGRSLEARG